MTLVEKILGGRAGQSVTVNPDYIVINDGFGHQSIDLIEATATIKNSEKVVIVIDHDVPAGNSESSAIFQKLVAFSKAHKVRFIQAKGITYLVMLDSFAAPNKVIVSCGGHNSIYGAAGALGLTVSLDVMKKILLDGDYLMQVPPTVLITLQGKLGKQVSPIDLFITFLTHADKAMLTGKALEFTGSGLSRLSPHEKTVLCSMATQTGALTAMLNQTPDGDYAQELIFDLSTIHPVVALPMAARTDQQFTYKKVSELSAVEFDAGFIGGYTGGYLDDLRLAAQLMENKKIALGFRLNVCPASSQIYLQAMAEGLLDIFIDFGAQILAPSDRNITLQGAGVIGPKEKIITTGSYNFAGCLGSDDAEVYIASVASVVKASLTKRI